MKEAAIEILKKADLPIPESRRQWTRIFEKAGLKELLSAKPKRAQL